MVDGGKRHLTPQYVYHKRSNILVHSYKLPKSKNNMKTMYTTQKKNWKERLNKTIKAMYITYKIKIEMKD